MATKVLIADEDMVSGKSIELSLAKLGFDAKCCHDGKEAIALLEKDSPRILITELSLPHYTGAEVILKARQIFGNDITILVASKLGMRDLKHKAKNLGADEYMTKPLDMEQLVETINLLKS